MAKAVPPRNLVIYISTRQEQVKCPDRIKQSQWLSCFSNFNQRLSYIQMPVCYVLRTDAINTKIQESSIEKRFKPSRCAEDELKRSKSDKNCHLTVFYEDIQEHNPDNKSIDKSVDEGYISRYCRIARLRLGVVRVDVWHYSNASVTLVKDEEDTPTQTPLPTHVDKPRRNRTVHRKTKKEVKGFISPKVFKESLMKIMLPKFKRVKCLFRKITSEELKRLIDFPKSKLRLRDIKIPPDSVEAITFPAKRRSARGGQRTRSRNQNSQNSGQRNDNPMTPVQVTDGADSTLRPDMVVTSIETIFSRTNRAGMPPMTTNLMPSIEVEERLNNRIRGINRRRGRHEPLRPPRYPDFQDLNERKKSFTNWPQTTMQDANHMAKHGFFYTGRFDLVRCFQCGIGMKDWSETDEPLFEHIRHSPECSFLLDQLGPELLAAYKVNLIPSGAQPATGRQPESGSTQSTTPAVPVSAQAERNQAPGSTSSSTGNTSSSTNTPAGGVRSPQYGTLDSRIRSFASGWPSDHTQTPATLADAGFYFTGHGDVCRCFTCDGGLQRWDRQDDPWIEHARWFPRCSYVIEKKGQEYIDLVQRAANDSSDDEEEEDPAVVMGINNPGNITGAMGNLTLNDADSLSTDAAKQVIEMGFSKKSVLLAIHELNAKGKELNASLIVDVLQAKKDRGEALPTDTPPNEVEEATDPLRENDTEYLVRENVRLRSILKCVRCEVRDANILFIPCTHHKMCEECAEDTLLCPACGRDIEKKVKTYMS